MNFRKTFSLTLLLAVGFSLPNCGVNCNCDPIDGLFFDIQDMVIEQYTSKPKNGSRNLGDGATLKFADYAGLGIEFDVEYVATQDQKEPCRHFSLLNEALACDCLVNGLGGSKDEHLDSLTVTTFNDFDDEHPANSVINDLFAVLDFNFTSIVSLDNFVANTSSNIKHEKYQLHLSKAPEINKTFKVKVSIHLSTGEVYEKESVSVVFED